MGGNGTGNEWNGLCISCEVTKETGGGHLFSALVPMATDSNCEGSIQKIISKMDHHTLIRGLVWASVGHIKFVSQLQ